MIKHGGSVSIFYSKSKPFKGYGKDVGVLDLTEWLEVSLRHRLSSKGHKGCGPKTKLMWEIAVYLSLESLPVSRIRHNFQVVD